MKKFIFPTILILLTFCCSQPHPNNIDDLFKTFYENGIMKETKVSKFQFDTSEAIILTGFATNYSQSDSNSFTMVPGGANDDLKFTLRNLSIDYTISFHYIEIKSQITLPHGHNAVKAMIAPLAQVEVFSFNLKDLQKIRFERWYPGVPEGETVTERIILDPGIYEFTWVVGFGEVSKPAFFKISH